MRKPFKVGLMGICSGILTFILMQRDWALVFVPIVLSIAIILPLRERLLLTSISKAVFIHLLIAFGVFGIAIIIVLADLNYNLNWALSDVGLTLMMICTGMTIVLLNKFVFAYTNFNRWYMLGGVIFLGAIPWIADYIVKLLPRDDFNNMFWYMMIMWQGAVAFLIAQCTNTSDVKMNKI